MIGRAKVFRKSLDYSNFLTELLSAYDIHRVGPKAFRSRCPFHGGDNPNVFSVTTWGLFHCFKCKAQGDLSRLVMRAKGLTLAQAEEIVGSASTFVAIPDEWPSLPPLKDRKPKEEYPLLREATLGPFRAHCPRYMLNRGFSISILKRYEVCYDTQQSKIVFPVRDWRGKLVGITYRKDFDMDKDQPSKYWHDHFTSSMHLYGFHLYADRPIHSLAIVEGQPDVIRMGQLGYPAVGVFGSNLSDEQVRLLLNHCKTTNVIIASDNDEAGEGLRHQAIMKLSPHFPHLQVMGYSPKDPGELTDQHQLTFQPWYHFLM